MKYAFERIAQAIDNSQLSYRELSKLTGIPSSTLQRYASGQTEKIPIDKIEAIAKATKVSPTFLMGWEDHPQQDDLKRKFYSKLGVTPVSKKKIPLLGNVACGEPIYAEQSVEAFISVDENMEADFCLRAQGDSMINARIFDGDFLFVKKQAMVDDGDIALVIVEDEATVKRVYYDRENNVLQLIPENPKYKILRYVGAELDRIRILGKIVAGQYKI